MRGLLVLCLVLLVSMNVLAQGSTTLEDRRAQAIGKGLRCVVCQNQSIEESDSELAEDMRKLIRQRIAVGDSDSEIRAYMQSRYGDYILMRPPMKMSTLLLWGTPIGTLGLLIWLFVRMTRTREGETL